MEENPSTEVRYLRSPALACRLIAGETIVVPISRGTADLACVYTFNGVGDHIWRELETPKNAIELAASVQEKYGISREQALSDISEFLNQLRQERLIVATEEIRSDHVSIESTFNGADSSPPR
jgi:hypothetical protein